MTTTRTTTTYRHLDSPIGQLTLAGHDRMLTHLVLSHPSHPPVDQDTWVADPRGYASAVTQLDEYFAGARQTFDLSIAPNGTAFQRQVWEALRTIPFGETRTYGQIATAIGRPKAFRAVGLANGRNPISIIVPCHRVIGASGDLTGYGGGLDAKRTLLDLERRP